MRKMYFYFVLFFLHLSAASSFASSLITECKANNYSELVRCAEGMSSEIQIFDQQLKSAQKLEDVAKQWVNPELDIDSVTKGSEKSETNATLLFTLRTSGKSKAQVSEAQSELERVQASRDLGVHHSRLEFMLNLYRLSHLKSEIKIEEESVETFSKIIKQFQKRAVLSPEQDVSLSVFKMALADHQLKLTRLKSDEEKLYLSVSTSTGLSKSILSKNLPAAKQTWPSVESAAANNDSPQVRIALAELKLAQSQKQKSESDSWPDIKIGPTMKAIKENGESTTLIGLSLSTPLPIFNLNGASRAYAVQKIAEAEMSAEYTKRKTAMTRSELVNRYNQSVQSLKNTLSFKIVNEKHEKIEKQFFKGVVPSSLMIEAHRQIFDLEERRNITELEAIETLGRILIHDNNFNEVIL